MFTAPTPAQRAPQDLDLPNFDIRTAKDAISDAYMERLGARPSSVGVSALARARAAGLTRLQANLQVDVVNSPELGTPEIVSAKAGAGFLTSPNSDRAGAMRTFLSTYADT